MYTYCLLWEKNDIQTSNISKVKKLNNKFVDGFASITFLFPRLRFWNKKPRGAQTP